MFSKKLWLSALSLATIATAQDTAEGTSGDDPGNDLYAKDLSSCPGYVATKQWETRSGFYADLELGGDACNVFGIDLPQLKLEVEYETEERLHVKILVGGPYSRRSTCPTSADTGASLYRTQTTPSTKFQTRSSLVLVRASGALRRTPC